MTIRDIVVIPLASALLVTTSCSSSSTKRTAPVREGPGAAAAVAPSTARGDPLFTNMTIDFHTLNDDRDDDTRVEVWINKVGEHAAAYVDLPREHFDDGSHHIFDVPPKGDSFHRSDIPGSWIQIRIRPNGNDTWKFEFVATLRFDDGSTFEKKVSATALSQDVRQGNYPLP
jgi:hypothetical protein